MTQLTFLKVFEVFAAIWLISITSLDSSISRATFSTLFVQWDLTSSVFQTFNLVLMVEQQPLRTEVQFPIAFPLIEAQSNKEISLASRRGFFCLLFPSFNLSVDLESKFLRFFCWLSKKQNFLKSILSARNRSFELAYSLPLCK